jgi:hypothetical protein
MDDHFFVERLSVESWERTSHGARAFIRNHSAQVTVARIHEFARESSASDARQRTRADVRRVRLAGDFTSELRLSSARSCSTRRMVRDSG